MRNRSKLSFKALVALMAAWLIWNSGVAMAQGTEKEEKPQPAGPTQNVEQSIEALFGPEGEKEENSQPEAPRSQEPVLYITDTDNGRIVIMQGIEGEGYTTMGLPGYGFGRFLRPAQIWVDWAGRVYVADSGNDRVVRLDQKSARGWEEYGKGLSSPMGVAASREGIYVADTKNNRILVLKDLKEDAEVIETLTHTQLTRPTSLWVDSEDALYICCGEDPPGGKVFKTWKEKDRRRWRIYEGDGLTGSRFRPSGLVTTGSKLKLLDGSGQRIINMQNMAGKRSKEQTFRGDRRFRLSRPQGVAVDQSGKRFYVADSGNDRILEVRANGEVVGEFRGKPGDPTSLLRNPASVFVFSPAPPPEPEEKDDDKKDKKDK